MIYSIDTIIENDINVLNKILNESLSLDSINEANIFKTIFDKIIEFFKNLIKTIKEKFIKNKDLNEWSKREKFSSEMYVLIKTLDIEKINNDTYEGYPFYDNDKKISHEYGLADIKWILSRIDRMEHEYKPYKELKNMYKISDIERVIADTNLYDVVINTDNSILRNMIMNYALKFYSEHVLEIFSKQEIDVSEYSSYKECAMQILYGEKGTYKIKNIEGVVESIKLLYNKDENSKKCITLLEDELRVIERLSKDIDRLDDKDLQYPKEKYMMVISKSLFIKKEIAKILYEGIDIAKTYNSSVVNQSIRIANMIKQNKSKYATVSESYLDKYLNTIILD